MSSLKEFEHLRFPFETIKLATNNFGDDNKIGQGGFGKVYKGELLVRSRGQTIVAVKRLDPQFGQGLAEFWKEIMTLSCYKHENLVSLLGYSEEDNEKILVYEYMSNQSLDNYLSSTQLSWIQRLNICIGAARGLEYLHYPSRTMQRVLHRDIKSSNILLDNNWNAKISDFGLSKLGPANDERSYLMTNRVGTLGYCDPVYIETGMLTKESDIYSFGVVLFEVLCGRLCCVLKHEDIHRFLPALAQRCYEEKKIGTIVHTCLQEQISPDCLKEFTAIAYKCLKRDRNERPSTAEIIKRLEYTLQYQVRYNFEKDKKLKCVEIEEDIPPLSLLFHHGDMTEEQLKAYDGKDPQKPILIAIKGQIYDVSRNRMLYEPDGPFAMFAGKDANKALAKTSSEEKDSNKDVNDPSPFELEILKDWQERFTSKYAKVGLMKTRISNR